MRQTHRPIVSLSKSVEDCCRLIDEITGQSSDMRRTTAEAWDEIRESRDVMRQANKQMVFHRMLVDQE